MATVIEEIPLAKDSRGVYRVGGTRVTLDLVVNAFNRGAIAEEIAQKFPSLELSDVYQVLGYYLKYRTELGEHLKKREVEEDTLLAGHAEWSPAGLRERLMARRKTRRNGWRTRISTTTSFAAFGGAWLGSSYRTLCSVCTERISIWLTPAF